MSGATGSVSEWLIGRIRDELRLHRVVVWYDPDRTFESIFDRLDVDGAEALRWEGSYFALRQHADVLSGKLRQGKRGGREVLVYVPQPRLDAERNVLLALECLGTFFDADLMRVALEAVGDRLPKAQVREWATLPGASLEKLDELVGTGSEIAPLDAVFGKATPQQVGFALLREPGRATDVDEQGLLQPLGELLERTFGVAAPETADSAVKLRDAFIQRVLLHEFLDDLEDVPEALSLYELPKAGQVAACRDLAQQLRETRPLEAEYRRWAAAAQQAFSLVGHAYDPAKLGGRDTFEFEERLSIRHARDLALADRWGEALEWARERSSSFWATTDEVRGGQWLAAQVAAELRVRTDRLLDTLPKRAAPADWVARYAHDDGLWQVDRLARRLDSLSLSFAEQPELTELVDRVRERVHELERIVADRFGDALRDAPDALTELPQQASIFERSVAPVLGGKKVAFVLADALRFEMGCELGELLGDDGRIHLDYAVATPPTITKVGMAALVPGAEDGVRLAEEGGKLVAEVSGGSVVTVAERLERFRKRYGGRVADVLLDDVLSANQRKLSKLVGEADLIVLRSQEIDAIGEHGNLFQARTFMSQLIANLGLAMRRFARAGVQEFVVTADHGYLLREDIGDAMKLDRPTGELIELHRRCAVGREFGAGEHHLVFSAADFGLGAEVELAFPRGINVFKVPGNLVYLHGGLSLQELMIPVLRFTPAARAAETQPPSVELALVGEKVVNTFFQVRLVYQAGDLFEQEARRRFRVLVVHGKDQVVGQVEQASAGFREAGREVELRSGEESVLMLAMTEPLSGKGALELRAVDVELGDTVARTKVRYDIAF